MTTDPPHADAARARRALSLRGRLLIPLLVMFLALAVGQVWHFLRERDEMRESAARALLDRAKAGAAQQYALAHQAEAALAATELPAGARLIVLDGRGTVVALHPALPEWLGRSAAGLPLYQRIRAHGGEGTLEEVGLDGRRRLFGFTPLPKTQSGQMYLLLTLPKETAEAPAQRNLMINLAIAVGGLAAGMALLILAAHGLLVRPLLALSRTAERLGAGDLGARSGLPHGDDEIGRLARTLDETGAALAEGLAEQRRNEEALRLAACVFHSTQEGVMITDAEATILSVNRAFGEITGYAEAEIVGQKPNLLRSEHHPAEFYQAIWEALLRDGHWQGEIWNRRKDGAVYLQWTTISAVPDANGRPGRYVSVFHDITERRRKDERIRHLAFHDPLTGLPNRALFLERLEHALARSRREQGRLSVTFIDLDGFKAVNDSLGHDIGDLLLKEIAERIRVRLRRGADTVARLGGDEFVVLMEDLDEAEQCACLAGEIIADIARPMTLRGHLVQVGASMGMAFFPEDGMAAQELMRRADTAMYAAKLAGKGTYRFYSEDMLHAVTERLGLEDELRLAIERGELVLHYQPKVGVLDGRIHGVEALVRWLHPHRGLLPPDAFLPLAMETGLILALDDWVVEEACRQAAAWHGQGLRIAIAVNLSARHLAQDDLAERIEGLLARYALPATALQVELTEAALMADPHRTVEALGKLRTLGLAIVIDDFGTGYSSLSRLRSLPIDMLKIDRSFVGNADRDEKDAQVVRTVVALARSLGLEIIAEGVESAGQAELLKDAGCTVCQGFHYAEPRPAEGIAPLLQASARLS